MPATQVGFIRRWWGRFWWLLDATRRTLFNLVFLAIVLALLVGMLHGRAPKLEDNTTLVLALTGPLVEQQAADLSDTALAEFNGGAPRSTQLRDVLSVLDTAAADPKISRVLLMLDDFQGGGLASMHDVAIALQSFRAHGKKVLAWGSSYNQRQYELAAQADEVFMHPMGMVYMPGFGGYQNYYRDVLDKLGVTVNFVRVGSYKSFGEPFIANGPSKEAADADAYLYQGLWGGYTDAVEKARKLPAGSLMALINDLPQRLTASGGDAAQLALQAKLVDGLKTRDQLRELMMARGAPDAARKSFRQVAFNDYLAAVKTPRFGDAIGVVVAEGEISDGNANAGSVGGLSTAELVRRARNEDSIKAVVLRVNSPGGSAFGAELIRRELELTRAAGKPVVVSMGDVAASGGYWVSMAADEVLADAGTVTGSIGVFALLPTADKALAKLGVHTAGTTTTWLGGAADPRLPLDPRVAELVQSSVSHIYQDFTSKAAAARKTTPEKIDAVAQGRVWTGAQALERGLIDRLGGFREALKSAALRADLGAKPRVVYIEAELSRTERLLALLGGTMAQAWGLQLDRAFAALGLPVQAVADARRELGWLLELNPGHPPFVAVTHCLCQAP